MLGACLQDLIITVGNDLRRERPVERIVTSSTFVLVAQSTRTVGRYYFSFSCAIFLCNYCHQLRRFHRRAMHCSVVLHYPPLPRPTPSVYDEGYGVEVSLTTIRRLLLPAAS